MKNIKIIVLMCFAVIMGAAIQAQTKRNIYQDTARKDFRDPRTQDTVYRYRDTLRPPPRIDTSMNRR